MKQEGIREVGLSLLLLLSTFASAQDRRCPYKLLNASGCGGTGAVVLNVSTQQDCCEECSAYSCATWTFGHTAQSSQFPEHNCAIMSTFTTPRSVMGHTCGVISSHPTPSPPGKIIPCNADVDCALDEPVGWRCTDDSTIPMTQQSNCHIPGPGTAGNASCSCKTGKCGATAISPQNSSLKQYLMIGDSISLGMQNLVFGNLSQRQMGYECTHNPGNAASSNLGAHCLDEWTQSTTRTWHTISFQFGLHDIAFDTERITVQQYTALLRNITDKLTQLQRRDGTKLLWVKTTPVPTVPVYHAEGPCNHTQTCLNPPRYDADVVLYNAAADQVIADAVSSSGASISTLDLYSRVLAKCGGQGYSTCPGFQLPSNVHYTSAGWEFLAQIMVQAVLDA